MSASESSSSDRASQSSRIFALLHRYRNLLRKHWWVPALTVLLALSAQGFRLWRTPPTYRTYATMVTGVRVNLPTGGGSTIQMDYLRFYETEATIMQSSIVLNRAANNIATMHPEVTPPPEPVKFSAVVLPRNGVFQLSAVGREPRYTELFLTACIQEYLALRREQKEIGTGRPELELNTRLARYERELKQMLVQEDEFRRSNRVEVLQGMSGSAQLKLGEWDNELNDLRVKYSSLSMLNLEQQLELLEKDTGAGNDASLAKETAATLANSGAGYLKTKRTLELKRRERDDLATRLKEQHPKMLDLNDEIQREEKLLEVFRRQSSEGLTNKLVEMKQNIETLTTNIDSLRAQVLDINTKMAGFNRVEDEIKRLRGLRDQCEASLIQLQMARGADPDAVTQNDAPSPAVRVPVNYLRELILALAVGLAVGSGLLFIMDRLDDRLATFTELQDVFDEPILGQVPAEKAPRKGQEVKLLQPEDSRHAFVEAYRNIRSSLLYMATEGKRAKTIVVTSAIPGDGKSKTSANLAITLAQSGSRVLLVDADLRRGQLHKRFEVENGAGFTEILTQGIAWEGLAKSTYIPTLSLISRGALSKNPGELFLKPTTHDFLKSARELYDYVVIDTAPVMAADDVSTLSPHVDGVVFVIRAGHTSGRIARAALDILYQREVNVLGLVFNGVEAAATEYYFYKYKDYSNYSGT